MLQRVGFDVYGHAQRATGWMWVQNVEEPNPTPLKPTHPSAPAAAESQTWRMRGLRGNKEKPLGGSMAADAPSL